MAYRCKRGMSAEICTIDCKYMYGKANFLKLNIMIWLKENCSAEIGLYASRNASLGYGSGLHMNILHIVQKFRAYTRLTPQDAKISESSIYICLVFLRFNETVPILVIILNIFVFHFKHNSFYRKISFMYFYILILYVRSLSSSIKYKYHLFQIAWSDFIQILSNFSTYLSINPESTCTSQ